MLVKLVSGLLVALIISALVVGVASAATTAVTTRSTLLASDPGGLSGLAVPPGTTVQVSECVAVPAGLTIRVWCRVVLPDARYGWVPEEHITRVPSATSEPVASRAVTPAAVRVPGAGLRPLGMTVAVTPGPRQQSSSTAGGMLLGVDVSVWQGAIDWQRIMAAGYEFAWIRAGYGTRRDPNYMMNVGGAIRAGVVWGPYHYWESEVGGRAQAESYARIVQSGPYPTLRWALDIEDDVGGQVGPVLNEYARVVESLSGHVPVVYTRASWWNRSGDPTWGRRHPLWVASYTNSPAVGPVLPTAWSGTSGWVHQYTASLPGRQLGVESPELDGNVFHGSMNEFLLSFGQ